MKTFITALLLGAVVMVGGARAEGEIAFVSLQEVFDRFYKTQIGKDQIRNLADDIKRELEEMEKETQEMKAKIEQLRADARDKALSVEKRSNYRDQLEEKLVELQKKEQEMIEYDKRRREQMAGQNRRMTAKLVDEIHESIRIYSKAQGFTAVMDRSAKSHMGTDAILYVDPQVDITAAVLAVLNEGREGTLKTGPEFKVED